MWLYPNIERPQYIQLNLHTYTYICVCIHIYIYMYRKWQSTPGLLTGESHEQRSLVGYSPWGCKELDTIEQLHSLTHTYIYTHTHTYIYIHTYIGFLGSSDGKLPAMREDRVQSLGTEDLLKEEIITHFNILMWRTHYEQRSLAGYGSWDQKELDRATWLTLYVHIHRLLWWLSR